jgi:formate dehydrogenase maturation protein FdhE
MSIKLPQLSQNQSLSLLYEINSEIVEIQRKLLELQSRLFEAKQSIVERNSQNSSTIVSEELSEEIPIPF